MEGIGCSDTAEERVVFEVNGKRFEVGEVDPSTTLLQFLRSSTPFKSPKLGCGEGGCGACVVVLSRIDPILKQTESYTVSSCLTLLCSVNGFSITTSEGLGNTKDGFHPIHQRFAGFHASQCGFCTPGMCMSLFSALANAEKTNHALAPPGFSNLTVSEAEKAVVGNLCRCTGYRPIADVCKSFAADVDLEDLGINAFWRKSDSKEDRASKLPQFNPKDDISPYVQVLTDDYNKILNSEKLSWSTPVTLEELRRLLHSDMVGNGPRIKLVVGNTGTGYYKETEKYDKYIDLRYIPELSMVKKDSSGIEFGAVLPIAKVILYLKEECKSNLGSGRELLFEKIALHMEKVANPFVRNSASIGGNLVMAQRQYFPSDVATLLLGVGTTVSILTRRQQKRISFEEFLYGPPLDQRDVLLTVHIPSGSNGRNSRLVFDSYRAAPRAHGNALAYLNAAFLADVSSSRSGVVVNHVRLAFGAYGTRHATRARNVEEYLAGKTISVAVVDEAIRLVKSAVVPEDGTSHPAYRISLAVSFLFSFLTTLVDDSSAIYGGPQLEVAAESKDESLLSSGKQLIESSREYRPVGEPLPKYGATIQAAGEAVYVDDIPSPPNCLYGALICSTKPLARIKGVSIGSSGQPTQGIVDVISVKDIPKEGENIGATGYFTSEPLFADDIATFAGNIIAFVVADRQKQANLAARTAQVDYDTEGLDAPILTVEEAVKNSSFFDVPPVLTPQPVGDFTKGMAEADHKILSAEIILGSQYYFYMETQTALAIPDEDNSMVVYSSIQCPEYAHRAIAKCLGVPDHNVRVITRRLGGGFGGKQLKSMHVATACAVAAHKLRRPVRSYLDRKTDMIIAGGRHPMKITYSVGFKSNGKITALHLDILINAGISEDFSPAIPNMLAAALKKYNWGALSFNIKLCKTNLPSKSIMRAPGDVQGNFITEAIIERVASVLSMEVISVREINLHTYESLKLFYPDSAGDLIEYTLPTVWDKILTSSGYAERIAKIQHFNASNVWRKRGISCVPVVFEVTVRASPGKVSILWDGSVVVEVGGIEMGQGLWTKVKQATAYTLSLIPCEGTGELYEKVRVVQSDTLSLIQGGITAGSTVSEASCAAVIECCNVLVERLKPLVETLQQQMASVKWTDLILQAHSASINLAAQFYFVPESTSTKYLNYGAAVSEVEIEVLTGETTILRTDMIYDCGQSMNPAVDMGQLYCLCLCSIYNLKSNDMYVQIEGCLIQGIGFCLLEEYLFNEEGLVITDSTWDYKIPALDNIPKQLNVEVMNSGRHQDRVLSSKASGEPALVLAASVHCAVRSAIIEARKQLKAWGAADGTDSDFLLDVPATLPVVNQLCGLNYVEVYLHNLLANQES